MSNDGSVTVAEAKESVVRARAGLESSAGEVMWQIEHQVWTVLDYADWNTMRKAEYDDGPAFMVPAAVRPKYVHRLRDLAMSQQDIADTVGVSQRTVSNDLLSKNAEQKLLTDQRTGITTWSRQVQDISSKCPIGELTADEVRELHGAAEFLLNYCEGELVMRNESL